MSEIVKEKRKKFKLWNVNFFDHVVLYAPCTFYTALNLSFCNKWFKTFALGCF